MPRWLDRLLGRVAETEPSTPAQAPAPRAKWLAAGDPGNAFAVPVLDLMLLQRMILVTRDPACADRSASWCTSVGKEIVVEPPRTYVGELLAKNGKAQVVRLTAPLLSGRMKKVHETLGSAPTLRKIRALHGELEAAQRKALVGEIEKPRDAVAREVRWR